ncbi:DUF4254 domain-containing protein [Herbaspirillum sp. HC18]|nr:DUF4254 domain-containing protein [Herbaspirillum sp. HC18]
MFNELDAARIVQFHEKMLSAPDWPACQPSESSADAWLWIEENHRYNTMVWNEEDKARRTDVGSGEIAASKRLIDQYNQKRHDAVEAIDEAILTELGDHPHADDARLNSETAGSMIDRLSILSLKIIHMREQTMRADAGAEHIGRCSEKLQRLMLQREDLASCFDALLRDAAQGRAYFKVYRQFKMYNDPALNPYLYGTQGHAAAAGGMAS